MREYGKVTSRLWTGRTGKAIRGNAYAQALASYLVNCPHGNMIGLFHLPFSYIQADLGWSLPRIKQTLDALPEDFVLYDYERDRVLVMEAWRIELCADDMGPTDNRKKQVANLLRPQAESPLVACFLARYPLTREAISDLVSMHLIAPPEGLRRGSEGASDRHDSEGAPEGLRRGSRTRAGASAPVPDPAAAPDSESDGANGKRPPIPTQSPIPLVLGVVEFLAAWQEFREWRAYEKHKAMTKTAELRMLAKLEPFGVATAIAALHESIANDWQGVFPEKVKGGRGAGATGAADSRPPKFDPEKDGVRSTR